MNFDVDYYLEIRAKIKDMIARMKSDLESYAKKPKANEKYVKKQNSIIKELVQFYNASDSAIHSLVEQVNEYLEYKRTGKRLQEENRRQAALLGKKNHLTRWLRPSDFR